MTATPAKTVLSDREIRIEHTFRAPAARVFAAYTDPKQVPQWWGFPPGSLQVESMDVRVGGGFRFLQRLPDGTTLASRGSYLEVRPVTRLVYTFQMEGMAGDPVKTTVDLAERDGGTALTLTLEFPSREVRDVAMRHGAAAGAKASVLSLAKFLGDA